MVFDVTDEIKLAPGGLVIPVKQTWQFQQLQQDKPLTCEIKEKKDRRADEASRYSWLLIDQIAAHDKLSSAEVYMQYLRDNPAEGVRATHSIQVKYADVWERGCERYCKGILKTDHIYYEAMGESDLNVNGEAKAFRHYRIYLGQSHFDTKQMWCFIKEIEADAKSYGIETLDEYKTRMMMEDWEKAYQKREEKRSKDGAAKI
jgi:hypothetical protein